MPHKISDIQKAYNILVGGIDEKAHSDDDDGGRAYGGVVRSAKGTLVESIAKNLVEIAWQELKGNPERLSFVKETVKIPLKPEYLKRVKPKEVAEYIKAHIEKFFYGHKTDVHVSIDGNFVLGMNVRHILKTQCLKEYWWISRYSNKHFQI